MTRQEVSDAFKAIQDRICEGLEQVDGVGKFIEDIWHHEFGGGGRTRVLTKGNVFEKGGVNFSSVEGNLPEFMKTKVSPEARHFFATGVSLVMHPGSPMIPIVHANIRYFETDAGDAWFGGGIDLTPIYVLESETRYFHTTLKEACDRFAADSYSKFKVLADDYFFIKHRNETRGVGGIFFDYLRAEDYDGIESIFEFVKDVGNTFLPAYIPIVSQKKDLPYTQEQKQWQLLRRGRYVEFNLVYDRGTRFGLETGGRIESILMSLPEHASWLYDFKPTAGGDEDKTLQQLRKGIDRV